jgi:GNAT superfamily N-acetyltransferase
MRSIGERTTTSTRGGEAAEVRIAPAWRPEEWAAARALAHELVDWMAQTLDVDVQEAQSRSAEEFAAMHQFYAFPNGVFLIGYFQGAPAGTAGIHLLDDETAELKRVWVTPAARGHGLAARMLETAISAARTLGARRIWLETEPSVMATAHRMYLRHGFREIPHYTNLGFAIPGVVALGREL